MHMLADLSPAGNTVRRLGVRDLCLGKSRHPSSALSS